MCQTLGVFQPSLCLRVTLNFIFCYCYWTSVTLTGIYSVCGLRLVTDSHETALHALFDLRDSLWRSDRWPEEVRRSYQLQPLNGLGADRVCTPRLGHVLSRGRVLALCKEFTPMRLCYSDLKCHYSDQSAETNNRSAAA